MRIVVNGEAWEHAKSRGLWLGASCHTAAEIALAEALGADFVLLSPFAHVPHKPKPLGEVIFASLAQRCRAPVVALGGVGPDNAENALKAGSAALSCVRAVLESRHPALVAQSLLDTVDRVRYRGEHTSRT